MELYQSIVGGKLELYAADEHGTPRPAEPGDRIQHARLYGAICCFIETTPPKRMTHAGERL